VLYGYSLAFGPDIGGVIGGLKYLGLNNVGLGPGPYAATIPDLLFVAFQLMFAIITPALITGAYAERIKFSAFVAFTVLWSTLVYFPVCHWVWGGGWIQKLGALDFAGGTVIHINSAAAALAAALLIGQRRGRHREPLPPHNIPFTVLGAGLLWFGWFGFNAGSALTSGSLATLAFFTTHVATGAASVSWIMAEVIHRGKPTTLGAVSGAVAGLVAITPGAGFVSPLSAMAVGGVAGVICYLGILLKEKMGYDDALDVVAVHGIGGMWGALATGLFASSAVNPAAANGLFFGNPRQLLIQLLAAGAVVLYSLLVSTILLKLVHQFIGLRVTEEEEVLGLDLASHNETGYSLM
jgi:Amt family ammonium transporter